MDSDIPYAQPSPVEDVSALMEGDNLERRNSEEEVLRLTSSSSSPAPLQSFIPPKPSSPHHPASPSNMSRSSPSDFTRNSLNQSLRPPGTPQPVRDHNSHTVLLGPPTPSPADYSPNMDAIRPSTSPNRSFGRDSRFKEQRPSTPSAIYDVFSNQPWKRRAPSPSFPKNPRFAGSVPRPTSPGPVYAPSVDIAHSSPPKFGFGSEIRPFLKDAPSSPTSPPPNKYKYSVDPLSSHKHFPAYSFPREPKGGSPGSQFALFKSNANPSPSQYVIPDESVTSQSPSGPAFAFSRSPIASQIEPRPSSPGPQYLPSVDLSHPNEPGKTFARSTRPATAPATATLHHPGFVYSIDEKPIRCRSPTAKFGSSSRLPADPRPRSPGPQVYSPSDKSSKSNSPAWGFPNEKQRPEKYATISPGVAAYSPNAFAAGDHVSSPSHGFGRDSRDKVERPRSPGFEYSPTLSQTKHSPPRAIFGKEQERHKPTKSFSPSPAAYDPALVYGSIRPRSPTPAFGKEERLKSRDSGVPAANAYAPNSSFTKPSAPRAILYSTG